MVALEAAQHGCHLLRDARARGHVVREPGGGRGEGGVGELEHVRVKVALPCKVQHVRRLAKLQQLRALQRHLQRALGVALTGVCGAGGGAERRPGAGARASAASLLAGSACTRHSCKPALAERSSSARWRSDSAKSSILTSRRCSSSTVCRAGSASGQTQSSELGVACVRLTMNSEPCQWSTW